MSQVCGLLPELGGDRVGLLDRDQLGVGLGQVLQQGLALRNIVRELLHQLGQLPRHERNQSEQDEEQHGQEQQEHQDDRDHPGHADALQPADHGLQQVGDHDAGEHRGQPGAETDDDGEEGQQEQAEDDDLRIGKGPLEPVPQQFHERLILEVSERQKLRVHMASTSNCWPISSVVTPSTLPPNAYSDGA